MRYYMVIRQREGSQCYCRLGNDAVGSAQVVGRSLVDCDVYETVHTMHAQQ